MARDVYAFLLKLLRRYPQYRGRKLYVFGESCEYKWMPCPALAVVE